jgi:hypothetical protein
MFWKYDMGYGKKGKRKTENIHIRFLTTIVSLRERLKNEEIRR